MSIFSLLSTPASDDVLLFAMMLLALGLAAYLGHTSYGTLVVNDSEDTSLVSGAILSLSGLLIGFMFSLSIGGYVARGAAEIRETLVIGKAWQYAGLQMPDQRKKIETLLKAYLDDRIHFFTEDSEPGRRTWLRFSREKQHQLWREVAAEASHNPTAVMASVLAAYSELDASLQETQADWRRQIPDVAWAVLILFASCASFLSGYQYRGRPGLHVFILLLPGLTALTLFVIAEIDLPGEGIIRVAPVDLRQLASTLSDTSGRENDLPFSVHHVY
ncbi:hypothetical protein [Serratia nevei]|uniref:hypothetical protein n=1 Tax=Serratia nevei TaxID=2703794 RepID=UPI00313F22D8